MDIVLLLRLLFAHILADFVLQTDRISAGKRGGKRYGYQLLHSMIQGVVSYLFVAQWGNWMIPVVIFSSHFLIDFLKLKCMRNDLSAFVIDQFLHLLVILVLWGCLADGYKGVGQSLSDIMLTREFWMIGIGYLLILRPSSIFLNLFIKRWTPADLSLKSLPNAGTWIGYLERILILTFILTKHMEAVGFLLAAKSIFRFGELNKAKEIKVTEYVLIGTFASFTIAVVIGIILHKFL